MALTLCWAGFVFPANAQITIASLVDQVSQTNYQHYLDNLLYTHNGDNRGPNGAAHDLALTNILNELTRFGLQTALEPFTYQDTTYYNVVGVLPGKTARSNEIYIIGAHYDSVDNPGADDDGSGVAALIEAARVLSAYPFEATLVFAAFDQEEVGLYGSQAYVDEHLQSNIRGMISLDMIAQNSSGNKSEICCATNSISLMLALSNAVALYGNGLTVSYGGPEVNSDNYSFENSGFPACLFIESGTNAYYHSPQDSVDTPGYIDYVFATQMTRSTVGFLATQAGLLPADEPSAPVMAQPAEITATSFRAVWNLVPDATNYLLQAATSQGFESPSLVPGFQSLAAGTATAWPLTGLNSDSDYYYRVQAQTSQGVSAFSAAMKAHTLTAPTSVAARLSAPVFQGNGQFMFQVTGENGKRYLVQASTNLSHWMDMDRHTAGAEPFQVIDDNDPRLPVRFYRVVEE